MSIAENILRIKSELPASVRLAAVSKFHPLENILEAYSAGQRLFAESRPQELYSKVCALRELQEVDGAVEHGECALRELQIRESEVASPVYGDIEWHFIGHLQRNKLKFVLPYVSMVESVDSLRLLEGIDEWGRSAGRVTNVLLECHISNETSKQGFLEDEVYEVLGSAGRFGSVRFCGLMGMASFSDDEAVVRGDFGRIRRIFDCLRSGVMRSCDDFRELSIGMSGDYKIALEFGATIVRIGTDIFGERF
ncbi:MAG: YggS family pyridoxal phosphate enzyme [Bacteroidales bacterium]|nr:YggS family pyridoxal phosphate enzyme [Bacteroidales bacterium]